MDSKWSCTKWLTSVSFWTCSWWISYQFSADMYIDLDPAVLACLQDAADPLHKRSKHCGQPRLQNTRSSQSHLFEFLSYWERSKWMWRRCHNDIITPTLDLNLPLTGNFLQFQILIPWFSYWMCACAVRWNKWTEFTRTPCPPFTLSSPTCEVRTTKDTSPNFVHLVLRNGSCIFKTGLTTVNKVRLTRLIAISFHGGSDWFA